MEEQVEVVPGEPGVAVVSPLFTPAVADENALVFHAVPHHAHLMPAGDATVLVHVKDEAASTIRAASIGVNMELYHVMPMEIGPWLSIRSAVWRLRVWW
jgi:hypothetical protein